MENLTLENAKEFALGNFKQMSAEYQEWNLLHSESIIEILRILVKNKETNLTKLFSLAWVHDIGKAKSEENHAVISLGILKNHFNLDKIDEDCILNHGSSMDPQTEEGKIFRYADGLSLFTDKVILFKIHAEKLEGKNLQEIFGGVKKAYEKYKVKYSKNEEIIKLLDKLYTEVVRNHFSQPE
ncbi:HD domain protein [uncultured archaeon]|nr:HD domain protein [uncultured archaeon]